MNRPLLTFAAAVLTLSACEGFKEAMSAHQDVVARAGSQELSTERLADLIGNSRAPVSEDVARQITDLWVNYQLLGQAAARNDSLKDPKAMDEALWPMIAQGRASKWHEQVSKSWSVDTAGAEGKYNQGELLAAQHILFVIPEQGLSQHAQDSIKQVAERVRAQVTPENFGEMAKRYSMDPGSKDKGGYYKAFPKGQMVKEFENAVIALKPGEIAPGLVRSSFGWHIIRRPTFAEVKDEFAPASAQSGVAVAESTYLAGIEKGGNIKFKDNAAATIREVMIDPDAYGKDNSVIATTKAGDFTASKLSRWIGAFGPQQQQGMKQGAKDKNVPDSVILNFAKQQFIRGELVLAQADSAKVQLDPKDLQQLRSNFVDVVTRSWSDLGVSPSILKDSAKSAGERERVAGSQVDKYLERLLNNQVGYVQVPQPVQSVLRDKYDWRISKAGITRTLERAQRVRAAADSARSHDRPGSQVPMPMPQGAPQGAPPGARPPAARPPATQPPAAPPATKQP